MQFQIPMILFFLTISTALSIPVRLSEAFSLTTRDTLSMEKQLYNRHAAAGIILQEPVEKAQKRVDEYNKKVKRGEYTPPHHPKYRPTNTGPVVLETGNWDQLALIKKRMEDDSLLEKMEMHQAKRAMPSIVLKH